MSTETLAQATPLTAKDFSSDQEVRWCPGCGDYSILAQVQKVMPTIGVPKENIVVPGIYYFIFQRLAWEGIIINEVISTSNEFTILVSENEVDVAFKVIKDLKN